MNFKTFDQLSLYYETHGDPGAVPVVLIHGIGADHEMWKPQLASFPASGYFVIVPDLRGHGASDLPQTFSIADCARDLHDLLASLGIQQAHLVGISMGGMVAQQYVLQYPASALSLVLVDSLSGVTRALERFNACLAAFLLQFFPPKTQASMIVKTYSQLGHAEVGKYFETRLLSMPPAWLLAARREVNRFTVIDSLASFSLPVLVLVGDAFGKLAIDMARTSATRIPGAQLEILTGGGDPSNLLVPEAFDSRVLAFLAAHSG